MSLTLQIIMSIEVFQFVQRQNFDLLEKIDKNMCTELLKIAVDVKDRPAFRPKP